MTWPLPQPNPPPPYCCPALKNFHPPLVEGSFVATDTDYVDIAAEDIE